MDVTLSPQKLLRHPDPPELARAHEARHPVLKWISGAPGMAQRLLLKTLRGPPRGQKMCRKI